MAGEYVFLPTTFPRTVKIDFIIPRSPRGVTFLKKSNQKTLLAVLPGGDNLS
jgi:hypothetical protein